MYLEELRQFFFDATVMCTQSLQDVSEFLPALVAVAYREMALGVHPDRNQDRDDDVAYFLAG